MDNRNLGIFAGICGIILVIGFCCLCLAVIAGSFFFIADGRTDFTDVFDEPPIGFTTPTPLVVRPTAAPTRDSAATPAAGDEIPSGEGQSGPAAVVSSYTLDTLEEVIVPVNDLPELAQRLGGKGEIPETVDAPAQPYAVGDEETFWLTDTDTNENYQVGATLRYVTDHLYFWIENGVSYDPDDLQELAETFEHKIYPTNREFFGSEWSPGVDNDERLYVLYARRLGGNVAGYFSSADEYHPDAHEYSNAHEMFMLSAEHVSLDEEFAYSVLAHEFQHMIHWYRDRNEESWMNEGFAELAAFLNGYDVGGADWLYVQNPDIQLNTWPNDPSATLPHYGNSFLFLTYFLDRFGEEATKALVGADENGMKSIDEVLQSIGATDPETGEPLTANDVFADWVVASYIQDASVEDGRFTYHNYPNAPQPGDTETINRCPTGAETRDVNQYGVDYIRITCEGEYTLHFEGSVMVGVVPADPFSGEYAFWSNKGDESDMTLTRSFDFTGHTGPLTLNFHTWYDIEEDYDYLYLEASTDGGETWQILTTPSGTDEDPSGNSYGWAYNGLSGGGPEWIEESVDISQFAGQEVLLRFEYITDAAVNGEGFLLDDISIPEVGYETDFEADDGGWTSEGWARIQNMLPQTFQLAVIRYGSETTVEKITVSGDNSVDIPLEIGGEVDDVVLVVSGTTPFTRQKAAYRFEIAP